MKLAILFSGQGTQFAGMGLDFALHSKTIEVKMNDYSEILDLDLKELLNNQELINDTRYTQPLMVSVEMLIHDHIVNHLGLKVDGYAGFSLGEFTALYAAGFYKEIAILKIINERAKYMQIAGSETPGLMAAVLSLSDADVESICKEVSDEKRLVVAANYNSPGQLVISGEKTAVEKAVEIAKEKGARRAIILNVSGAFHSPYMSKAGRALKEFAAKFSIEQPQQLLYANSNAKPLLYEDVLDEIETQIQSPVYFKQTIENMIQDGFTHFLEVGPGQVLSGLVKKINSDVKVYNVSKYEDLDNLKEIL